MKTKSQTFDPTTYLARDALLIREIFVLMRGKNPARSRLPSENQDPLFQAFKIAIDSGELPAKRFKNGEAFLNTIIYFDDLCTFVKTHKNDPTWTRLYEFAERWAFLPIGMKDLCLSTYSKASFNHNSIPRIQRPIVKAIAGSNPLG